MKHVELIRLRTFLTNGEHLEPAQALSLIHNLKEIVPFIIGKWLTYINFQALQFRLLFLGLFCLSPAYLLL